MREHRYTKPSGGDAAPTDSQPVEVAVATATEGDVIFINDSLGLHKVVNPSPSVPACTLHLYAPPFQRCHVWLDCGGKNMTCLSPVATYHSEFGEPTLHDMPGIMLPESAASDSMRQ